MSYPWHDGETLTADDLNAAISDMIGPQGPAGSPGILLMTGYGPPTEDAPDGTTYVDLSNGDIWRFGEVPSSSYHAPAVHFDGSTWLFNAGLTAADSPTVTFSGWAKGDLSAAAHAMSLFDLDTTSDEFGVSIGAPGLRVAQNWYNFAGDRNAQGIGVPGAWINGAWNHVFGYVDTNHPSGGKIVKTFLNGVDVSGSTGDESSAFSIWFDGVNMALPDNTDDWPSPQFIGDMADWWIAPGVFQTDITLFRDPATGKPKDPAGFPAGAVVLFSGNAAAFGTNRGTGGAFTMTGALTNATSSPSD